MGRTVEQNHDVSFYRALINQFHDGLYFVDRQRRITFWSDGAKRITGHGQDDVVGRRCADGILCHVDAEGRSLCQDGCPLLDSIKTGKGHAAEVYLRHRDGHRVAVTVRTQPIHDEHGRIIGGVEIFSDATARLGDIERIRALEDQALVDALTGLHNRRYGEMKLASARSEWVTTGKPFGVLVLDVDHFKRFNDTFGHAAGDAVLRTVAQTLRTAVRPDDIVCRWGGEEFLVLAFNADDAALRLIAERCRSLVERSCARHEGRELSVTVSIGTAGASAARDDDIVKLADQALYRSKAAGRNRVTLVAPADR